MKELITLIIILHNRHKNIERLLEYYKDFDSPIIIADSSKEPHIFKNMRNNLRYLYTPGITYTQKLEQTLTKVFTPYISLCADDDFIITQGLYKCVDFLEENKDYSASQGQILSYYKYSINQKLRFGVLYKGDYSLFMNTPLDRLQKIFNPYKSLLYAVHKTSILKIAFRQAGKSISNLYLNEYLISIMPVLLGKIKDMPFLYQVREYADNSDDKLADNLDLMLENNKYEKELSFFQDLLINNLPSGFETDKNQLRNGLLKAMESYSEQLKSFKNPRITLRKKIGKLIWHIPFLGEKYVEINRFKESQKELKRLLSEKDFSELEKIETLLKKTIKTKNYLL